MLQILKGLSNSPTISPGDTISLSITSKASRVKCNSLRTVSRQGLHGTWHMANKRGGFPLLLRHYMNERNVFIEENSNLELSENKR